MMRKINIYGTLGPACADLAVLKEMFACGMTGMRLNLSHVSLEQCEEWLSLFHQAADGAGVAAELLVDLQGPELRIGQVSMELQEGQEVVLAEKDSIRREGVIPVPGEVLSQLKEGQQILMDDGKIMLTAVEGARCKVVRGGTLLSRKSIALPGIDIDTPALTVTDMENLKNAKKYGVTGVMQPFVRSASDLLELRREMEKAGCPDVKIFAKIENRAGIDMLEELFPYANEIVIARGDLGNAMPLWELPGAQYQIGEKCKRAKMPYMVVTQMLSSMEHAAVPTRAEVSDIFYAVLHGASSVMVTGETAAGEYPVEVMKYLCETVKEACRF